MNTDKARKVTELHIDRVRELLSEASNEIMARGAMHDQSKFDEEELVPLQKMQDVIDAEGQAPFGSVEYKRRTAMLGDMLEHHYARNRHHPEHFENGVSGMCLFDLIEMFMDWKAASERGDEPSMNLTKACDRHNLDDQLTAIFYNTAEYLGFKAD